MCYFNKTRTKAYFNVISSWKSAKVRKILILLLKMQHFSIEVSMPIWKIKCQNRQKTKLQQCNGYYHSSVQMKNWTQRRLNNLVKVIEQSGGRPGIQTQIAQFQSPHVLTRTLLIPTTHLRFLEDKTYKSSLLTKASDYLYY